MTQLSFFLSSLCLTGLFLGKGVYFKGQAGDGKVKVLNKRKNYIGFLFLWGFFLLSLHLFGKNFPLLQSLYLSLVLGQVLWMGYLDFKTGGFYYVDYGILALLAFIYFLQKPSLFGFLASLLAGLFFFLIEKLTGGFGEGDKYFVFLSSLFFDRPLFVYHYLATSFILAGGICGLFMLLFHWDRKKEIPLGPFLSTAFIGLYFFKEVI